MEITLVKASGPGDRDRAYLTAGGIARRAAVHVVHDLPHLAVESAFGINDGLWAELSAGSHAEAGRAAAARDPRRHKHGRIVSGAAAGVPAAEWLTAGHRRAKTITNCVANQWGDGPDTPRGVRERARQDPCAAELLDRVDDDTIALVIAEVRDLLRRWAQVPAGGTLRLSWPLARPGAGRIYYGGVAEQEPRPAPMPGSGDDPELRAKPAVQPVRLARDGRTWRIGTDAEVAWIVGGTSISRAITAAIPPVFDAYATVVLPEGNHERERRDLAVWTLLREHSPRQAWWLGYLDTGADDIVFPGAPMVTLYAGWPYVLVEAGPEQAATWRGDDTGSYGALPNLLFPADRSWLVSTLWDDDWSCIGGPAGLVGSFLHHPDLRARQVDLGQDATPPGHQAL